MEKEKRKEVEIGFNNEDEPVFMSQKEWDNHVIETIYKLTVARIAKMKGIDFDYAYVVETNGDEYDVNYYN